MKKHIPLVAFLAALSGIAALLTMLIPAYTISSTVLGSSTKTSYSLYQLTFGCDVTTNSNGDKQLNIGLLIAFILLILGVILSLAVMFIGFTKKDKKAKQMVGCLGLCGFLVLAAAGVLFFFTMKLTGLSTGNVSIGSLASGSASIGAGFIITGILAVFGALCDCCSGVSALLK